MRPLPREVPASLTITNQSAASAPRTTTVTIAAGAGAALVHNYASFPPVGLDPNDAQAARANQLAMQRLREGNEVEIEPMADGQVHAGDLAEFLFNSHGVTNGFYQIVRGTHPLGTEPTCTLLGQLVNLSLA